MKLTKVILATLFSLSVLTIVTACTNEQTPSIVGQDQAKILATLRQQDPALIVDWNQQQGRIILLGRLGSGASEDVASMAHSFLVENAIPRRIEGVDYKLLVSREQKDKNGWSHVSFDQSYRGIPVWGKQLIVHVDSQNVVAGVNGHYMPEEIDVDTRTALDGSEAIALALAASGPGDTRGPEFSKPQLVIYEKDGIYRMAWKFTLPGTSAAGGPAEWRFFVNAVTGQILDRFNRVRTIATEGTGLDCDLVGRQLNTFDADNLSRLQDTTRNTAGSEIHTRVPGGDFSNDADGNWNETQFPVRNSQQPEVSIHYWLGQSYDRLKELTGREGWDNQGLRIKGIAHYFDENNAYWFPNELTVAFGGSEGSKYRAFSCANDIIAHEFMHGVIEFTAQLDNGRDANAMNESFADMFASMVDMDDWLLGEGASQSGKSAFRDIGDPTRLGHPDHYNDIPDAAHKASNITSHAFYLASEGLRHTSSTNYTCDVSLGRRVAFKHFYYVLDNFLSTSSDMPELANAVTFTAASILARGQSERADVFEEAFRRVGLSSGGKTLACVEPWVWMAF